MSKKLRNCELSWLLRLSRRQSQYLKTPLVPPTETSQEMQKLTAIAMHGTLDIVMLSVIYIN